MATCYYQLFFCYGLPAIKLLAILLFAIIGHPKLNNSLLRLDSLEPSPGLPKQSRTLARQPTILSWTAPQSRTNPTHTHMYYKQRSLLTQLREAKDHPISIRESSGELINRLIKYLKLTQALAWIGQK